MKLAADYVKIEVQHPDLNYIENQSGLEFDSLLNHSTGEISGRKIAEHHFCKITIYESGAVYFSGSVHKLWNSLNGVNGPNQRDFGQNRLRGFNGNQFSLMDFYSVQEHLESLFNCSASQMIIKNIEFGVNINTSFDPDIFIKGLLYHMGVPFEFRYRGSYAQAIHQRFIAKIYNKSKQYGLKEHTLRIEIKVVKTREIVSTGIITMADIRPETMESASNLLLKRFDEVVHYDYTINKELLSKHQKRLITDYSNPRYWMELKPNFRNRHKKRLEEITAKFSDNILLEIRQGIIEKCSINNRTLKTSKCSINNHSSIALNVLQKALLKKHGFAVLEYDREERSKMTKEERAQIDSINKRMAWVTRGCRSLASGNQTVFPDPHRKKFSTTKLRQSGNHAMIYLIEIGIPTGRAHAAINKKVQKTITVEYKSTIAFWNQFSSIIDMAQESYGVVIDSITFLDRINRTRGKKGLPQFLTSKFESCEKAK
ncbi:hypothetical protein MWU78_14400 [Arenibacter sp. F26102]|uniref:hypothetical protein n=1 Tax=Arenibacter sp. F26102 TaxID=2926416 RepID=UPI001FF37A2E|nr:hypothetical protein [Arenibacter sp. F26102]MCK0146845.1 hypothetical protein [Arenibacter sp. F26102]